MTNAPLGSAPLGSAPLGDGPIGVAKLGGSLLDDPRLIAHLRSWLLAQEPMRWVMVVGGGPLADAVRRADRMHALGDENCHWLCVRAMGFHAELLHAMLPESRLARHPREISRRANAPQSSSAAEPQHPPPLTLLDPWSFLQDDEASPQDVSLQGKEATPQNFGATLNGPLPHTWDVTSDSIAARLARRLGAKSLVLLKSRLPEQPSTLETACECGYVDRHFRVAAAGMTVRCVNLRDDLSDERFPEVKWEENPA